MSAAISRVHWLAMGVALMALLPAGHAQITESPHTVAPGKFLLEMDGVRLSMDRADAAGNTTVLAVGSTLVTTGVTSDLDVQFGADLFYRITVKHEGRRESDSGLGDVYLRTKWTFWRDPDWAAAAAVIPYVKVPTNRGGVGNDSVEGGVIVPWSAALAGATLGAMAQWDYVRNAADDGYESHWFASAYAERPLAAGFSLYGEATAEATGRDFAGWAGMIGGGALWQWSEHLQFDYQLLRGVNSRASDWTHVVRVNWDW